jgi:hypothetical protein
MPLSELEKKKRRLKDIEVDFVSLVKRPATGKSFFLWKSRDKLQEDVVETKKAMVSLIKGNSEAKRILYGVVYSPDEVDKQDDFMGAELIEKAAHDFIINYRNIDHEHDFMEGKGVVVESYIAPMDMLINEDSISKGSWVLAVKVTPEMWDEFSKGNITGFSLAGKIFDSEYIRTEEEEANLDENSYGIFWSLRANENVEKNETKQEDEVNMEELQKLTETVAGLQKSLEDVNTKLEGIISKEDIAKSIDEKVNVEEITKSIKEGIDTEVANLTKTIQDTLNTKVEELEKKFTENDQPGNTGDNPAGIEVVETSFTTEAK